MIDLQNLVQTSLAKAIGRTLIHSLWEGAIVTLVLLTVLGATRSPRVRYCAACLALLAMLASFGITFSRVASSAGQAVGLLPISLPHVVEDDGQSYLHTVRFEVADALPWLAPLWLAGVILFHLHRLASWMAAQRMRRRGVCAASDEWQKRLSRLRNRIHLSTPVVLLESCLTDVPVVIGYVKPVILVPVGMLAGMPAGQIDAILLHELAHVLRRDYLVNLLQTAVEGLLFYHPAVWWIRAWCTRSAKTAVMIWW